MKAKKSMRAWLARDKHGRLYLFKYKPTKELDKGIWFPRIGDNTFKNMTDFVGADYSRRRAN